jgi:hypothetical protein
MNKREQPAWTEVCHEPGARVRRFGIPGVGWLYQVEAVSIIESADTDPRFKSSGRAFTEQRGWHPPVFVPEKTTG